MESSPNASLEGGRPASPDNASSVSPVTSPSPSSPEPHTTNALPASFLSATDPDARRGGANDDDDAGTISRSPSVLVNPPGSTTSLSSLASDSVSVASSYEIEAQQPPYTEVQAAEDEPIEVNADDEHDGGLEMGRGLTVGRRGGGLRPASPVGSTIVEPGSKAPSISGDDDDQDDRDSTGTNPDEPRDAPLTPRAEHFRELSLDSSTGENAGDTTLTALDEDVKTPPAGKNDPSASMMGLHLDGDKEPEVEDAEMVPALVAKERESFEGRLEDLNGAPEVEIGGEAAAEAKVETWAEGVATAGGEHVEGQERAGDQTVAPVEPSRSVEDATTPPAASDAASAGPKEVSETTESVLEGEVDGQDGLPSRPAPNSDAAQSASSIEAAIPIAVATAFEEDKKDRGIDSTAAPVAHPASDFKPTDAEPTARARSDSNFNEEDRQAVYEVNKSDDGNQTPSKTALESDDDDDELKSPIPGSFPGSPTHSSFARSPSRSSSLARAPLTLHEQDGLHPQHTESAEPSPALDVNSFAKAFPSPPSASASSAAAAPETASHVGSPLTPSPSARRVTGEMQRSPSGRVVKPIKGPMELDSGKFDS